MMQMRRGRPRSRQYQRSSPSSPEGYRPLRRGARRTIVGHTPVSANSAQFGGELKVKAAKRSMAPSRDGNGRFHNTQKTSSTETYSQSKRTSSTSHSTPTPGKSKPRNEAVCTPDARKPTPGITSVIAHKLSAYVDNP